MLISDVIFDKCFCDGSLETDETLEWFMTFIDNFAPCDYEQQKLFSDVLVDCIKAYQKRAFRIGFKCCLDAFLETRSSSDFLID